MQVRQMLKINVAVSVITALTVLLILVLAMSRINRAMEASDIADDIVAGAFERNTFREDYLRTSSERASIQWFAKHEQTGRLLQAASEKFPDAEDRKVVDELTKDHQSTGKHFSAIVENRVKRGLDTRSAALSQEVEDRLRAQMNMRLYDRILNIRRLHASARGNLFSALKLAGWGIFFAFALITASALINSWTMGRSIADRITRLRDGALVIGGGNLDHRIDIKGDDEFAELSGSFNAMTAKLSGSYNDLKNEIAERKHAEEALRESEQRFRLMADTVPYGAWHTDATGYCTYVSPSFLEMVGMTMEQVQSYGWLHLLPPEDVQPAKDHWLHCVKTGENFEREHRFRAKDGSWRNVLAVGSPVRGAEGEITSWVGLNLDITERKKAEEALRTSERRYHSLFENMGEGFAYCKMLFDDRGHPADFVYLDVNSAFGRLTGLETVIGKKVTEAIPGIKESHPELFEIYGRVALTGSPEKIDIEFTPLNIWLSLSVYSVEKGYFVVVFDNITERKRAEEERNHALRTAEERTMELEAAIRELEGFTYSVSHDLRAPIRHMASYSQLLKEASWPVLGEKSRAFLTFIMNASRRLGILIDELLEFSRAGRKEMLKTPVDLDRLVREIVRGLSEETGDRTIEWNVASLAEVYGDPSMLLLVFHNLLANAVKFTRNRSTARIEVGSAETPEEHIVHVKDNGVGFDMEYYNKLFGVFQRLHTTEEFEGTGIGLANVQRIIHRHGGRVWAEGKVDEGATFYLSLSKGNYSAKIEKQG